MKHSKKKMYPGGGHMKKAKANNNMPKQQMAMGGKLKPVKENQKGLKKLPEDVRNKMGYMEMGGKLTKADKEFMYGGKMKKMMYGGKMKKMMKGGKMNYPGGGRTQLD